MVLPKPFYFHVFFHYLVLCAVELLFSTAGVRALEIQIGSVPGEMPVDQVLEVPVTLICSSCSDSYLRGVFFASGTSYFGQTRNNSGEYIGTSGDKTQYFRVPESDVSSGSWSGLLSIRVDTDNSYYQGEFVYSFKIIRYTPSGSKSGETQTVSIRLLDPEPTIPDTPVPTATSVPTPVPTSTSVPVSTPKPSSTPKPTVTPKPTATPRPSPTVKPTTTPKSSPTPSPVILGTSTALGASSSSEIEQYITPTLTDSDFTSIFTATNSANEQEISSPASGSAESPIVPIALSVSGLGLLSASAYLFSGWYTRSSGFQKP